MPGNLSSQFSVDPSRGITPVLKSHDSDAILELYLKSFHANLINISKQFPRSTDLFRADYLGLGSTATYETLKDQERRVYNEIVISYNMIHQIAERRAALNFYSLPQNNPYDLDHVMATLINANIEPAEIEKAISLGRQNPTTTAHPTGDLNEELSENLTTEDGVNALLKRLLEYKSPDPSDRRLDKRLTAVDKVLNLMDAQNQHQVELAIDSMMDMNSHMAPTRRMNTLEEMINNFSYAVRDRMAAAESLVDLRLSVANAGAGMKLDDPINPADDDFAFKSYLSTWIPDDTDGKPNAEHVALLAFDCLNLLVSSAFHLDNLKKIQAIKAEIGRDTGFKNIQYIFKRMQDNLVPVFCEVIDLYNKLHDPSLNPQERGHLYKETEGRFHQLNTRVEEAFKGMVINKRTIKSDRGVTIYSRMERYYRHLTEKLEGTNAEAYARQSAGLIHANGLGFLKSEARTNRAIVNNTIDNLFKNNEFITYLKEKNVLDEASLRHLDGLKDECFSELKFDQIERIVNQIRHRVPPKDILRFMKDSNPLNPSEEHGYPSQEYALLMRMEVKAKFELLHGPFITAEADHKFYLMQRFLMDAFNSKLRRTPIVALREELDVMTSSTEGNRQNMHLMREAFEKLRFENYLRLLTADQVQMWAQSDSQKALGPFSVLMILNQVQNDTRAVLEQWFNKGEKNGPVMPLLNKRGNGERAQRGGGDPMVEARLIAQTIQTFMREKKISFADLPQDFLKMALNVDYTVQGRATYKSKDEIKLERKQQMAEMLTIWGELKGVFKPGTAIPQTKPFSDEMAKFLGDMTMRSMKRYNMMREAAASPQDKDSVKDKVMEAISPRKMVTFSNNAARMNARGGKTKTGHRQQRAIGATAEQAAAGTDHDAHFTNGYFFREMHKALREDYTCEDGTVIRLSEQDIEDFKNNGLWNYQLLDRSLIPSAQTDFAHAFEKLDMKDWTAGQLRRVAEQTTLSIEKDAGGKEIAVLKHPQDVTAAQAWQALHWADFDDFITGLNALDEGKFNTPELFSLPDNVPARLTANFNQAVLDNRSYIMPIRERQEWTRPSLSYLRLQEILEDDSEPTKRSAASAWRTGHDARKEALVGIGYRYAWGRREARTDLKKRLTPEYGGTAVNDNTIGNLVGSYYPIRA